MKRVEVQNLSKRFLLPHEKRTTLYENAMSLLTRKVAEYTELWALRDLTFSVEEGEIFGVIGRNGSGKSTLLKLIANILRPTSGSIVTRGRVVPFIELGVGFQQDLTGKENLYLYGAILGMTKKELDEKYDEIVSFAELHEHMDVKLKNYSSGMQVRLAFSTAIYSKPEILLVDEVLAVGDISFQKKCLSAINNLVKDGTSIIFISHDLESIRMLCHRAMWLHHGEVKATGNVSEVVERYKQGANSTSV